MRREVEEAREQVPRLPAIVGQFKTEQARLQREVATTKEKLTRVRVNQSQTDFRLAELTKAAAARSTALEMKVERTSFQMREIDPAAQRALRDFAAAAITQRDEKIWVFDPNLTAGVA